MHAFSHIICICTRVAAAAEEVVYEVVAEPHGPQGQAPQKEYRGESAQGLYEVVAEPQGPQGQAPQKEDRGESAQGPSHPSTEQQTQGKPRCMSYYFKL